MYSFSNALTRAHNTLLRQRDLGYARFPTPSSCTDAELQEFWEWTLDKFGHYEGLLSRGFDTFAEEDSLLRRRAEQKQMLEEIDYEWMRRPWLH
jgi:hypothetical protein